MASSESNLGPSFEDLEANYREQYSSAVFVTDSISGALFLVMSAAALLKFLVIQQSLNSLNFWPRVLIILAFVTAVLVGLGPVVYLPVRRRELYIRSRDLLFLSQCYAA